MKCHDQAQQSLLSAFTAFAILALSEAQDIQAIEVPVLTEPRIQFFRLLWLLGKGQEHAEESR